MDDLFFHTVGLPEQKCCAKCKFIDWRACLVSMADEHYHGWDGTSWCGKCDNGGRELGISAYWKACDVYEEKDLNDHVYEMCDHILYAIEEFDRDPESCNGKTKHEVIANVLLNYGETLIRHLNTEESNYEFVRRKKDEKDAKQECEEA